MPRVSLKSIGETCANSIVDAFELYLKVSAGDWVRATPEFWYSTHIATSLYELGCFVTLETQVKQYREDSTGPIKGRRRKAERYGGKADAVVLWKTYLTPRGLVEIKRTWSFTEECRKDIRRIKASMEVDRENDGSLQFGLFAVATAWDDEGGKTKTRSSMENRLNNWKESIQRILGDGFRTDTYFRPGRYESGKNGGIMYSAVYLITFRD